MLRWEQEGRGHRGFCGQFYAALIIQSGMADYVTWEMTGINSNAFVDACIQFCGTEPNLEAAKAAAESAFRAWLDRAGATVIPKGWKLVPVETTGAMIDAMRGSRPYDPAMLRQVWRDALTAAPKPDYCNANGLEVYEHECGWCEWESADGDDIHSVEIEKPGEAP